MISKLTAYHYFLKKRHGFLMHYNIVIFESDQICEAKCLLKGTIPKSRPGLYTAQDLLEGCAQFEFLILIFSEVKFSIKVEHLVCF